MKNRTKGIAWLGVALSLILFGMFACLAGCTPKPQVGTYTPLISAALGETSVSTVPAPVPDVPVAGKCENCNGTGTLGDGTIKVPCPVCGGDGRTDNEPAPIMQKQVPLAKRSPVCDCGETCWCDSTLPCVCNVVPEVKPKPVETPKLDTASGLTGGQDCTTGSCRVNSEATGNPVVSPTYSEPATEGRPRVFRRIFRGRGG